MDNRILRVSGVGRKTLDLALQLAFLDHLTASYWREDERHGLILYWSEGSPGATPLPYPMEWEEAAAFIWGWLQKKATYEQQPDHDGDNERGFLVFCEDWGHVAGDWRAFVAVAPFWAMYGK